MIIKFNDTEIEYNDKEPKNILDRVKLAVEAEELALDHMIIDGVEVNNNMKKYIADHLEEIKVIEAVPVGRVELAVNNSLELGQMLYEFINIMDVLAEDFRQSVSERGIEEFENMIQGLIFIDGAMKQNFSILLGTDDKAARIAFDNARNEYVKLYPIVKDIEKAMFADKPEKAGDIIQNKVKPVCMKTLGLIETFIKKSRGEA